MKQPTADQLAEALRATAYVLHTVAHERLDVAANYLVDTAVSSCPIARCQKNASILAAYDAPSAVERRRLERAVIDAAIAWVNHPQAVALLNLLTTDVLCLEASIASADKED